MGELVTMVKDAEEKAKRDAWRLYAELLDKADGGVKDAEALVRAGKAVGRSAAAIEKELEWLQKVRAQQRLIQNGKGLRDQQVALEQQIAEMEKGIQAEIVKLRIPQNEVKAQLTALIDRETAGRYAFQAMRGLAADNRELAGVFGL